VQIDPAVNIEELAKIGHQMGELVGLGLRNLAHCPIELNLMPKSALKGQKFGAKKPYLIATMAGFVAILLAFGYFNDFASRPNKRRSLEETGAAVAGVAEIELEPGNPSEDVDRGASTRAAELGAWLEDRDYWGNLMMEIRNVLIKTERAAKEEFQDRHGNWIESFKPDCATAATETPMDAGATMPPARAARANWRRAGRSGRQDKAEVFECAAVAAEVSARMRRVPLSA